MILLRKCPVDAKWSSWASQWSICSGNCKKRGEHLPKRSRSRTCISEEYGGKNCTLLESTARMNKRPIYTEEQACSELPECPTPATLTPWSEWSSCTQTCFHEGQISQRSERKRSCRKGSYSTDEKLNANVVTCKSLGEVQEFKNCTVAKCPGVLSIILFKSNNFFQLLLNGKCGALGVLAHTVVGLGECFRDPEHIFQEGTEPKWRPEKASPLNGKTARPFRVAQGMQHMDHGESGLLVPRPATQRIRPFQTPKEEDPAKKHIFLQMIG